MGRITEIAWTDHTFNPWIGCTKVSSGCANCYAERQNKFYQWNENGWGKGKARRRTTKAYWKQPLVWDAQAEKYGVIRRVFCASLADVFDNEVPESWRIDLFELIGKTNNLEWLLLTKRPQNIKTMIPYDWATFDAPDNVRIGVTAENQEMANGRIPILLADWHGKNFVSVEPMIGAVDLVQAVNKLNWLDPANLKPGGLDWVICGCESGSNARPMNIEWARSLRDQCVNAGVPFFLKQMTVDGKFVRLPELDGMVWNEFPEADK